MSDNETLQLILRELAILNRAMVCLEERIGKRPTRIVSAVKTVTTPGDPCSLGDVGFLPFECEIVIKALQTNTGTIYVGNSKVEAGDHMRAFPLQAGDAISYRLSRSGLYIDASKAGEGVAWTTEVP